MRRFFLVLSVSATGVLCSALPTAIPARVAGLPPGPVHGTLKAHTATYVNGTVVGVPAKVPVRYDVELGTTGPWEARGCAAAGGSDKLTGTITGIEPMPFDQDNDYTGILKRETKVRYCSGRSLPSGEAVDCGITITGSASFAVVLTVHVDARGGYLKVKQAAGPLVLVSGVTGDCDPGEMAQLQNDYGSGETAGSPNGQPIAVHATDSLKVKTYPPNRAANEDWTLTVLRRLP